MGMDEMWQDRRDAMGRYSMWVEQIVGFEMFYQR
jgi:hypothetical protein